MLVCKIEIWPGGNEAKARELQRVLIANIGGTETVGEYSVVIPKSAEYAKTPGVWKRGRIFGFPRKRLGPADLLLRALTACIEKRNPEAAGVARVNTLGPDGQVTTVAELDAAPP